MSKAFVYCDELGPEKIIEIYDPHTRLRAVLVVDNVAMGPSIGGIRMASDVSVEECVRLARAMTLKNSAAGLPHGGGKAVIVGDPAMPSADKERLIRSFAHAIADIVDYIPGPDMGTNEVAMAWVKDAIGRAVGLPREVGGIPLDEIGATGFGLCVAIEAAERFSDLRIAGARVAIQGFGSVGKHAARFLCACFDRVQRRGSLRRGIRACQAIGTRCDFRRRVRYLDSGSASRCAQCRERRPSKDACRRRRREYPGNA
jgi:glutamate dehydrogenase (NAD(P)+)